MNVELKRIAPPLKTVCRPMSPGDFSVSNSHKQNWCYLTIFKQESKGENLIFITSERIFF
ncbi:MAG: hypothetical protein A2351_03370 [Omnitrophica bacterium RIFOXYB12_FULL_50_7]|nr:MAG: hypothetical protein A2351_03370 [Omnitrophica bacterium RIFOXYB12_FULL_50_7]